MTRSITRRPSRPSRPSPPWPPRRCIPPSSPVPVCAGRSPVILQQRSAPGNAIRPGDILPSWEQQLQVPALEVVPPLLEAGDGIVVGQAPGLWLPQECPATAQARRQRFSEVSWGWRLRALPAGMESHLCCCSSARCISSQRSYGMELSTWAMLPMADLHRQHKTGAQV
jgi:hypothetical protein